jgi:hypothetical protein
LGRVQVALFGGLINLVAPPRGGWNVTHSRSEGSENWVEPLDDLGLAPNHHAIIMQ